MVVYSQHSWNSNKSFFVFFAWNWKSSGSSHVGSLFTKEDQKNAGSDVMCTSVTHAGLVHDVTDMTQAAPLKAVFSRLLNVVFLFV